MDNINIGNLQTMANEILSRASLQQSLGKSYGGDRDLYEALGYPRNLEYGDFDGRFQRQDIASTIVKAYPKATWRTPPSVLEDESPDETTFEKEWKLLVKNSKVYHYLRRVDIMAGIGQYAILLIGFNDGRGLEEEVGKAKDILYLQPYNQNQAEILEYDRDPTSPRYGRPLKYSITVAQTGSNNETTQTVIAHYSRVLHVADETLDSDVFGTPRLQQVYNRLQDLEMISGGSAEMFWRGAFPGYAFEADPEADLTGQTAAALETEIESYFLKLNRYMRLQGLKVNSLSPQVVSPTDHFNMEIALISATTGIPKRILLGTEEAKLAGDQDDDHWNDRVDERRKTFAEPMILREFIDMCMGVGVITYIDEYIIEWPDLKAQSDKDKAEIALQKTRAIKEYATSGAEMIIPPFFFFTKVLDFTQDEAEEMMEEVESMVAEEERAQGVADEIEKLAEEEANKQQLEIDKDIV